MFERLRLRREARFDLDADLVFNMMARFPRHAHTGNDLQKVVRLKAGRLYSVLMRLETQRRITSRWSDTRPRRRLYQVACEFGGARCRVSMDDREVVFHSLKCEYWIPDLEQEV